MPVVSYVTSALLLSQGCKLFRGRAAIDILSRWGKEREGVQPDAKQAVVSMDKGVKEVAVGAAEAEKSGEALKGGSESVTI